MYVASNSILNSERKNKGTFSQLTWLREKFRTPGYSEVQFFETRFQFRQYSKQFCCNVLQQCKCKVQTIKNSFHIVFSPPPPPFPSYLVKLTLRIPIRQCCKFCQVLANCFSLYWRNTVDSASKVLRLYFYLFCITEQ